MLNTPNILSLLRLCMVPVYVIVYFSRLEYARVLAAVVYALATLTDVLDGHIARKHNLITNLGKVLDPLGDKMLTVAVLARLAIGKEAMMGIGGLVIHRRAKVEIPPSNYIGKSATALFFVICVILMVFDPGKTVSVILISFAVFVSLVAFAHYLRNFIGIMKTSKEIKE